ncbi:hypothetical protein HY495_01540 [Candidatus Woesearchaeota archaeon]|nr:hypothetical protein [Candidatus Woesearchaeota archaeon]
MAVQQAKPAVRSSKPQSSTAVPVVQHKGRMIGLIIFAIVLVAGIAAVLLYGTEFAGKAVAIAPSALTAGEAGIPIKAGTTMKVGETQAMAVYANLGQGDAYGFRFLLRYDPKIIQMSKTDFVPVVKGITLLSVTSSKTAGFEVWEVVGMSTDLKDGKPMKTLREVGSTTKKPLVPLVRIKNVKALQSGLSGLSFTVFEVYDKDTDVNLITKKQPQTPFYVGAAPVAKLGEGAACNNNQQCESKLCAGGVCTVPVQEEPSAEELLPVGAQCTASLQCASKFCDSGECRPQPVAGGEVVGAETPLQDVSGACSGVGDCLSGLVCTDGLCKTPVCTDSDYFGQTNDQIAGVEQPLSQFKSINYGVAGTVKGWNSITKKVESKTDFCVNPTDVSEYYCDVPSNTLAWTFEQCPTGLVCTNGACVTTATLPQPSVCPSADWSNVCCVLTDLQFKQFMNAQLNEDTPYTDLEFKKFMNKQLDEELLCTTS